MRTLADTSESALLAPSEALTRFNPYAGALLGPGEQGDDGRVRYGFRVGSLNLLIQPDTRSEVVEARGIAAIRIWLSVHRGHAGRNH